MKKATVILAHPRMSSSYANKEIIRQIDRQMPEVEVRDIASLYPDFQIDVQAEQKALEESDVIVFQFPWWWYSSPAILKHYLDEVLEFGWAYGPNGNALVGKHLIVSTTAGGGDSFYKPGGANHFYIDTLLSPFEETALKARMIWHRAVRSHDMAYVPGIYHSEKSVKARAKQHADELINEIKTITEFSEEEHIKDFLINDWFPASDDLEENGHFTAHFTLTTHFDFDGKTYKAHEGFVEWIEGLRATLKPGTIKHTIQSFNMTKGDKSAFKVFMTINIKAQTIDGQAIDTTTSEEWSIDLTVDHKVIITERLSKTI
ncbi:NAD(P)H-dependent oxidoreductase [Vibrio sp. THAF190c]|uniref:NAD(P)H-dependent oxidoreductase n=1 Tax=Vibrio sp. THAF190c TaxID=2587865 RepID=UPI0012690595|nr:NAD(P)H-dependent oxidoreductase [Vibrio sp. THAF190c]QFT13210.1 General stress protein 14 [Vibrio sp. THAF190c]